MREGTFTLMDMEFKCECWKLRVFNSAIIVFSAAVLTWSWLQLQGSGQLILQSQARKVQQRHSEKQWLV